MTQNGKIVAEYITKRSGNWHLFQYFVSNLLKIRNEHVSMFVSEVWLIELAFGNLKLSQIRQIFGNNTGSGANPY